jgi:hypothetical protein
MLARHYLALCVVLSLLLWLPGICPARANDGPAPFVVIERRHLHYTVEADGAYVLTVEDVRLVEKPEASGGHLRDAIPYDAAVEDLVSVEAFVQTSDGRRIPARTGLAEGVPGTAFVSGDPRRRTIAFPDAAAGDRLVVRYAVRCTRPQFADHFAQLVGAPPHRARDMQVVFDLPAGMPLNADAAGFLPMQVDATSGRRRVAWRYADGPPAPREADAVSPLDDGPRLAVSTFADHAAFAAAVRLAMADAKPAATATADAVAQARQLTAKQPDAHARASALAAWVGRHVQATGAPQSALHSAGMLATMLEAAGIASTPALVNKGNAYKLTDTPAPDLFNHLLTWVPALDLYLDPLAPDAGTLPADVLGKPVLLLGTGAFAMTPLLQPHRVVSAQTLDAAQEARSAVGAAVAAMTREPVRRQTWVCPAVDAADETTFRLPPGMRAGSLPPPLQLMNGGIAYSASHVRVDDADGPAILVRRRFTFRHGLPTCSPADYAAMQPVLARIARDLRVPLALQPAGGLANALRQPRAFNAATASSVSSKRRSTRSRPER